GDVCGALAGAGAAAEGSRPEDPPRRRGHPDRGRGARGAGAGHAMSALPFAGVADASLGLLAIRIVAGSAFVLHGWPKMRDPFAWMGKRTPRPLDRKSTRLNSSHT